MDALSVALTVSLLLMRWALFGLMTLGLVLSSAFLFFGKIDGTAWATVCSVLFGSGSFAHGMLELGNRHVHASNNK